MTATHYSNSAQQDLRSKAAAVSPRGRAVHYASHYENRMFFVFEALTELKCPKGGKTNRQGVIQIKMATVSIIVICPTACEEPDA